MITGGHKGRSVRSGGRKKDCCGLFAYATALRQGHIAASACGHVPRTHCRQDIPNPAETNPPLLWLDPQAKLPPRQPPSPATRATAAAAGLAGATSTRRGSPPACPRADSASPQSAPPPAAATPPTTPTPRPTPIVPPLMGTPPCTPTLPLPTAPRPTRATRRLCARPRSPRTHGAHSGWWTGRCCSRRVRLCGRRSPRTRASRTRGSRTRGRGENSPASPTPVKDGITPASRTPGRGGRRRGSRTRGKGETRGTWASGTRSRRGEQGCGKGGALVGPNPAWQASCSITVLGVERHSTSVLMPPVTARADAAPVVRSLIARHGAHGKLMRPALRPGVYVHLQLPGMPHLLKLILLPPACPRPPAPTVFRQASAPLQAALPARGAALHALPRRAAVRPRPQRQVRGGGRRVRVAGHGEQMRGARGGNGAPAQRTPVWGAGGRKGSSSWAW